MTSTVPGNASQQAALAPVADGLAVRMRGASAVAGGTTVWSDVSLDVAAGEFVAVLGPNGCGKSTLLKVLLGLTPSHGMVEVLGARPGRRTNRIGYLPQRRAFDASVRIRGIDVVSMGLDGARWGTPMPWLTRLLAPRRFAERRRRLEQVIEVVGAADYAQRPIGRCSAKARYISSTSQRAPSEGMNYNVIRALLVAAAAVGIITGATVTAPMASASGPYRNCTEAHRDGRYNIPKGDPDYQPKLDRDNDGIACEG